MRNKSLTSEVLREMGKEAANPAEALRRRRRMDADVQFALEHLEDWRAAHPNSWIAVYRGELVAVGPTKELLLEALAKKELAPDGVYVNFLSEERSVVVL